MKNKDGKSVLTHPKPYKIALTNKFAIIFFKNNSLDLIEIEKPENKKHFENVKNFCLNNTQNPLYASLLFPMLNNFLHENFLTIEYKDNKIEIINLESLETVAKFVGHLQAQYESGEYNDQVIALYSEDNRVKLIEFKTGKEILATNSFLRLEGDICIIGDLDVYNISDLIGQKNIAEELQLKKIEDQEETFAQYKSDKKECNKDKDGFDSDKDELYCEEEEFDSDEDDC